jgi:hypothetical protein
LIWIALCEPTCISQALMTSTSWTPPIESFSKTAVTQQEPPRSPLGYLVGAEWRSLAWQGFIPVPDPKWGEVGRAIIVLKPGASLTQADLVDWLREQTAHYKVPKSVVFVDTLPKTAANKVDKQQLIEQYGT